MVKPDMMTAEAARVGEELRDARLALGATLDEVADELRINRRYIAALEEGRAGDLPGPAYALGFIRSYATALGLDAADLVRRYRGTASAGRGRTDLAFPEDAAKRGLPAGALILLGLVMLGGTYVAWWNWSGSAGQTVDAVPPVSARDARQAMANTAPVLPPTLGQATPGSGPGSAPGGAFTTAAGPRAPAGPPGPLAPTIPAAPAEAFSRVSLRATEEAWVQVRDPHSGQTVLNRVLRPGESFAIPRDGLVLTTGKAQSVEVLLDGQATQALAGKVGLVRDLELAPDQLRPPRATPAGRPPAR